MRWGPAIAKPQVWSVAATTQPLLFSSIESLLHVIEDPHGLLRIQPSLRIEAQFTKDLHVLGVPKSSLCLAEVHSERVHQHPVDIARLFKTRDVGHFAIAVPAENVAVFRHSQDAPHAGEACSHVPTREASGRGVPALSAVRHRCWARGGL